MATPTKTLVLSGMTALVVGLAACGGGGKSATATTSTTSTPTATAAGRQAALAAYDSCLTAHGIPASALARPGARRQTTSTSAPGAGSAPAASSRTQPPQSRPPRTLPAGVTQAQYSAAQAACRSKLPAVLGAGGRLRSQALAAYRNCLQINGVTPPAGGSSPGSFVPGGGPGGGGRPGGGGGAGGGALGGLDTSNPTVAKALAACASLRPTGPTTTTTAAS